MIETNIIEIIKPANPPVGNAHISGWDNHIWGLVYHVLARFSVPIWFKELKGDARLKNDHYIMWFVPVGHHYNEISRFIYHEMKGEIRKSTLIQTSHGEEYYPGFNFVIMPHTELMGACYVTKETMENVRETYTNFINARVFQMRTKRFKERFFQVVKSQEFAYGLMAMSLFVLLTKFLLG